MIPITRLMSFRVYDSKHTEMMLSGAQYFSTGSNCLRYEEQVKIFISHGTLVIWALEMSFV